MNKSILSWSRSITTVLIVVLSSTRSFTRAQEAQLPMATVTFYVHVNKDADGHIPKNVRIFTGGIFDAHEKLFEFQEGFTVKNDRRLTIRLPAGDHQLAPSFRGSGPKTLPPPIKLIAGEHYFFRVEVERLTTTPIIDIEQADFAKVDCKTAKEELKSTQILYPDRRPPALAQILAADQSIPTCPDIS